VSKVPVCFGLEGTLLVAKKNQFLVKFQSTEKKTVEQEPIVFFFWCWVSCEWWHKWGRFLAILAHGTWPRVQLLWPKYFAQVFIGN